MTEIVRVEGDGTFGGKPKEAQKLTLDNCHNQPKVADWSVYNWVMIGVHEPLRGGVCNEHCDRVPENDCACWTNKGESARRCRTSNQYT